MKTTNKPLSYSVAGICCDCQWLIYLVILSAFILVLKSSPSTRIVMISRLTSDSESLRHSYNIFVACVVSKFVWIVKWMSFLSSELSVMLINLLANTFSIVTMKSFWEFSFEFQKNISFFLEIASVAAFINEIHTFISIKALIRIAHWKPNINKNPNMKN